MRRNTVIRQVAALARHGRVQRALGRLLAPSVEVRSGLFGRYELRVDLAMGILQRQLFVSPESYEWETQMILRRLLEPGMTVMDIGANIGFFSILMADRVGATGRVHCFEPYPPSFALLAENLERNRLDWAHAYPVALADRQGSAVLNLNPINDGGHSLGDFSKNPDLAGWDREQLRVTVSTDTLDEFVRRGGIEAVHLIKVDVEGAETLVFSAATQLLREHGPLIICEVGERAQEQFGRTERDLRAQLYSHGYRSFFIGPEPVEFGPETPVPGLPNILFAKSLPPGVSSSRAPSLSSTRRAARPSDPPAWRGGRE